MNIERKFDMLAFQWSSEPWDFELMFSFEPERWGIPVAFYFFSYGGTYEGYDCKNRVVTLRLLCGAIHFSFDRTVERRTGAEHR